MRICLISGEIFAWNKFGGFGRSTRWIGRELVRRGYDVCAVVPRRAGQGRVEALDGITVYSFPMWSPLAGVSLYHQCNADIYHSQQPSLGTALAMLAAPRRKHVVTCRDIKLDQDWHIEQRLPSRPGLAAKLSRLYEDNSLVGWAVRSADAVVCAYAGTGRKAMQRFGLSVEPAHLPSPIHIPEHVEKSATPLVCYVGRWDRRKRPQYFFELASQRPDIQFVAVGMAQDTEWDAYLRETYSPLPNLTLHGFADQFEGGLLSDVFDKSWILINTSPREGLPTSFLEAAAHRCAVLACVNPDGFTERYGCHVTADTLAKGLDELIQENRWRALGEQACRDVRAVYESSRAMDQHEALYVSLLATDKR